MRIGGSTSNFDFFNVLSFIKKNHHFKGTLLTKTPISV